MMETLDNTIESQIAAVLDDIRQKGFSSVQPFSIGKVEARMSLFAQTNAIMLASDDIKEYFRLKTIKLADNQMVTNNHPIPSNQSSRTVSPLNNVKRW